MSASANKTLQWRTSVAVFLGYLNALSYMLATKYLDASFEVP